jgi:sterol desaturase/sphingolipid hydroxylase (fatty acid hydroxylase superfamily)
MAGLLLRGGHRAEAPSRQSTLAVSGGFSVVAHAGRMQGALGFLTSDLKGLYAAIVSLAACTVFFATLARLVKPGRWLADAKAAAGETRINAVLSVVDQLTVTPLLGLLIAWLATWTADHGLRLSSGALWDHLGRWPTMLAVVFVGDFVGYWRHRAQHSKWLWPAHAIHHSDTRLTWFSLERMHPVDRLGSALDTVILAALGFPFWAQGLNVFVRHYYGYLIHADVPWTLGKAGLVLNTPAMHRWHHARDIEGSGSNFATVFSIFDRAFGTYYQPGPCKAPLGVREDMGEGALGQYLHPFRAWAAGWRRKRAVQATA